MSIGSAPPGYHTVTPYLPVEHVERLIEFLKETFGAEEAHRMEAPGGRIAHAEVRVGDSVVMMGEPEDASNAMPAMLYVYVDDVDSAYGRALRSGATSVHEPRDEPYGDRTAAVRDASGNHWYIAAPVEEAPSE